MTGPEQVLRYLGRYIHRIAISDWRILKVTAHNARFSFRNRKANNRRETQTLPARHFVSRYLLHVVPRRFVRIRHYGLVANAHKASRLAHARALLGSPRPPQPQPPGHWDELAEGATQRIAADDFRRCPSCGHDTLRLVGLLVPESRALQTP